MLRKILNHLKYQLCNERGSWVGVAVAVIGAGASIYSTASANSRAGKGGGGNFDFIQLPEYGESDTARGQMGDKLTQWGEDPYYGAIQQDWGSIWENAQNKVRQYFWGGAADEGIAGKVKSSVARRGMQDSPAMEEELLKLGALESDQLKDLSVSQGIQRTNLANQGKQDWMAGISNLAGMKPAFLTPQGVSQGSSGNTAGAIAEGVAGIYDAYTTSKGKQEQNDWMKQILAQNTDQTPSSSAVYSGMASAASNAGYGSNWSQQYR